MKGRSFLKLRKGSKPFHAFNYYDCRCRYCRELGDKRQGAYESVKAIEGKVDKVVLASMDMQKGELG
jgi:hypothetical protein